PFVPAESVRALMVAIAQALAAIRPIGVLAAIRIAPQVKLERIEIQRGRELIHSAFERKDARRGAGSPHVARRRKIEPCELMRICRVGAFVKEAGPARLLPMEVLVLRGHRQGVVRDRVEHSVGTGTQRDPLNHRGPIAEPVHLLPSQYETYRTL